MANWHFADAIVALLLPPPHHQIMPQLFNDIPNEILALIVDFLQARTPSQTCQRAWPLLQRRYTRYRVTQLNVQAICETLVQSSACIVHLSVCSLDLSGPAVRDDATQALAYLKKAPFLHTLSLDFSKNNVRDLGAQSLASLKEAPLLHTLSLNCPTAIWELLGLKPLPV